MDIQHVGSTAIPNIPAKPIIDISVGIMSLKKAKTVIKSLKALGYEYRENGSIRGKHLFFAKGSEERRTHYLHLIKYNGEIWKNDLLFCDYLCKHKEMAVKYANLKTELANKFSTDRGAYTNAKSKFIRTVIKMANKNLYKKSE